MGAITLRRLIALHRSASQLRKLARTAKRRSRANPPSTELRYRVLEEQTAVSEAIDTAFRPNLGCLLDFMNDTGTMLAAIEAKHDFKEMNDLFFYGVLAECIEKLPPLPADREDRIGLYMAQHIMREETLTFDEARARVHRVQDLHNDANAFLDFVVGSGREAYRTKDPTLLKTCHTVLHTMPTGC